MRRCGHWAYRSVDHRRHFSLSTKHRPGTKRLIRPPLPSPRPGQSVRQLPARRVPPRSIPSHSFPRRGREHARSPRCVPAGCYPAGNVRRRLDVLQHLDAVAESGIGVGAIAHGLVDLSQNAVSGAFLERGTGRGSVPTMRMAALGVESTPPEYCNGATPQSRRQFVRHRQQLHHFRYRIAEDDARRPTSAGLNGSQDWRHGSGNPSHAPRSAAAR
jgi:hypothetical protein